MGGWDWQLLCGKSNGSFVVWANDDFGHCFEQLVFVCISHVLLAVTSIYHFSRHQHRRIRGSVPHQWPLYLRLLVAIFLLLSPLLLLALVYLYEKLHPSLIDIISWCIEAASWAIHSGFIWRLQRLFHIHIRGPTIVVLSYMLALASDIIRLRTVILHIQHNTSFISTVEQVFTFIRCGLHLFYLLSLIPYSRPEVSSGLADSGLINRSEEGESSRLLGDNGVIHSYGTTPQTETNLGVAEDRSGCLSKLTFWWVQPLMKKGAKGELNNSHSLFILPKRLRTEAIEDKFRKILTGSAETQDGARIDVDDIDSLIDYANSEDNPDVPNVSVSNPTSRNPSKHSVGQQLPSKQPSLISCLNRAFGLEYYFLGVLKFLSDGLTFAGPMLLNLLVTYMENSEEPQWHGYAYAGGLFASTFLGSLFSTHFNYRVSIVGLKVRAAMVTTIYHKSLTVSSVAASRFTSGEVINFMSTDLDRIVNFCPSFHQFWSLPVQIGVALYLLYQQVGLAFLAGLGFTILLIPINRWIAIKIGQLSKSMMTHKDSRVKMMNEILSGIRVIKFYAWEEHFSRHIHGLRDKELCSLKGRKYLDALCVYFWATTPVIISILTFMTYALMGHQLTAAKVFTSMALFSILIMPLNAFPWVINGLVEAYVSIKRIQEYLRLEELQLRKYYSRWKGSRQENVVQIEGGYFSWQVLPDACCSTVEASMSQSYEQFQGLHHSGTEETLRLRQDPQLKTLQLSNINLVIPKGKLVGVVGKVGSGKSSLLSCLLAEMHRRRGHISVQHLGWGFGLAAQEPWLQHATIRENILFGKEFVAKFYSQVLEACALMDDLKILPGADQTEVGERGVTLSGGQKARLALARAVYQDKDIYLLDDPLSAVDAHVAKHLFEQCIMGVLRHKTRVLATHHTQYLQQADLVVVMEDGRIVQCGPPDEVDLGDVENKVVTKRKKKISSGSEDHADSVTLESQKEELLEGEEEEEEVEEESANVEAVGVASLMEEEEKAEGVVKLAIYSAYWKAVGACLAPMVLLALFLMQASRNVSDWWLSYWVSHSHSSHHSNMSTTELWVGTATDPYAEYSWVMRHSGSSVPASNITEAEDNVKFYLTVYGSIAAANSVFTLFRAFLFAYGGVCAATVVHRDLLASILKAPVGFFDVTPLGRIMNRFSTDVYSVDDSLPFLLNILLAQSYGLVGTVIVCCYGLPWLTIILIPLGLAYYFIQSYYRQTSRELKRITSVSLSPIYAHFAETIAGVTTIRALRETDRFERENREKLDDNQKAQFASIAVSQWLGIRLQMIGVVMVTAVAFTAVLEHHFQTVNAGLVGLAMSYALAVTGQLNGVVTMFTETEKQMVSMERASHYIHNVPAEKHWSILNALPYWPIQGSVSFQQVNLQYRSGLPNALNNITFETQPMEKVGIVGRTGSGKSSLFLALFRMVEIQSGSICIDGINIGHLPLSELRSRLAVIPQDPFLFSGTVRDNLDPTHSYPDSELWTIVDKCHLKVAVERLGGLDADVAEKGRHFSAGQRQLVCLARAMITRAKVLCIDEATASVDQHTDALLQDTIRQEFCDNTVLTIAHRTRTILDSDRVLVMDQGKAIEFAPPSVLLQNPNSVFYSLVHGEQAH